MSFVHSVNVLAPCANTASLRCSNSFLAIVATFHCHHCSLQSHVIATHLMESSTCVIVMHGLTTVGCRQARRPDRWRRNLRATTQLRVLVVRLLLNIAHTPMDHSCGGSYFYCIFLALAMGSGAHVRLGTNRGESRSHESRHSRTPLVSCSQKRRKRLQATGWTAFVNSRRSHALMDVPTRIRLN